MEGQCNNRSGKELTDQKTKLTDKQTSQKKKKKTLKEQRKLENVRHV